MSESKFPDGSAPPMRKSCASGENGVRAARPEGRSATHRARAATGKLALTRTTCRSTKSASTRRPMRAIEDLVNRKPQFVSRRPTVKSGRAQPGITG